MLAFFRKLSPSERRLAVLAGVLLAGAILVVGTLRALDSLAAMDETIASLQQDLLYYKQQAVQADAVEKAYQAIAAQHSSRWTQEEIHDRLRREITRLTLKNLPKPGQEAPAAQANSVLIDIRSMPGGTLEDSNEGYRRYTINFHTEPAPAQNLAQFLERLQQSDQVLRVDTLDISRQPATNVVTAMVKVTRTVIGDATTNPPVAAPPPPQESGNLVRNAGFEAWDAQASAASEWTADGCALAQSQQHVTEGQNSLRITADKDGASLYQTHNLVAGNSYEVTLDLQAEAPATVTVADGEGNPLGAGQPAQADGAVYKYRLMLTVPGEPGTTVAIRAPYIVVTSKLGVVTVDNVALVKQESKP